MTSAELEHQIQLDDVRFARDELIDTKRHRRMMARDFANHLSHLTYIALTGWVVQTIMMGA